MTVSPNPAERLRTRHAELTANLERFRALVADARRQFERGNLAEAAATAQVASTWASLHHPGLWASPELEGLLIALGRQALRPSRPSAPLSEVRHVLHVITQVGSVGGHSRMVWRWIRQDHTRRHSVAITRQGSRNIPADLIEAAEVSGGEVVSFSQQRGNILTWAQQLRDLAGRHDIVILHIYPEDVLPLIALAQSDGVPPVAFVDQADHAFSLGAATSDLYVGLRSTGIDLAVDRRHVDPGRSVLLPIALSPLHRTIERGEAKRSLGIADDAVLLLSVARGNKFRTFEGSHFTDTFRPLLERNPETMLVVVGPIPDDEWRRAERETDGRIRVVAEKPEVAPYFQAADIYVDSFPLNSNTSMLEAGSYSVPLVSRCRYPGRHSIMCADSPGFSDHLRRSDDVAEYLKEIERLIIDANERHALGERTRKAIFDAHVGEGWQRCLERVYYAAVTLPRNDRSTLAFDSPRVEEVDLRWDEMVGSGPPEAEIRAWMVKGLPVRDRVRWWFGITLAQRYVRPRLLVSEWVAVALRSVGAGVRSLISQLRAAATHR